MREARVITIDGKRWRIRWKSYLGHDREGNEFLGRCFWGTREIHIKRGMSNEMTALVLVHEVQHAQCPKHHEDAVELDSSDIVDALIKMQLIAEDD